MEQPDKWLIIKITGEESPLYKVFATWVGGYLDGDSWKLNSGIDRVAEEEDYFLFYGYSGSCYKCHKKGYGTSSYGESVLNTIVSNAETMNYKIERMPERTDWFKI